MRIVTEYGRAEQDRLVSELTALFAAEPRPPRVVDRRAMPIEGYRAVHVIVYPDGHPMEIQVRTRWQHQWAGLFERLADAVGRGIRYGEAPTRGKDGEVVREAIEFAHATTDGIDAAEEAEQTDATKDTSSSAQVDASLTHLALLVDKTARS
jgi:ppGpp synthetase/RelA/SpoT-type nucleotidyltranferase